jgi:hypothetical protein
MPLTIWEKAFAEGQRQLVRELMENRFGPVSPAVRERLAAWPVEQFPQLALAALDASALRDLGWEEPA